MFLEFSLRGAALTEQHQAHNIYIKEGSYNAGGEYIDTAIVSAVQIGTGLEFFGLVDFFVVAHLSTLRDTKTFAVLGAIPRLQPRGAQCFCYDTL